MSQTNVIKLWAAFLTIAAIFGIANKGFKETWWMWCIFLVLGLVVTLGNWWVIKRRKR